MDAKLSVRDVANTLAVALDRDLFDSSGGVVPRSFPYLAMQSLGVDLGTFDEALAVLETIGLVRKTTETIVPGPRFDELAAAIRSAVAAHFGGPPRVTLFECWTCHTFRPGRDPVVLLTPAALADCRAAGHDVRAGRS